MKKIFFLVFVFFILLGCEKTFKLENFPFVFNLEKYDSYGNLISEKIIENGDPLYKKLKSVLKLNKNSWERSFASYATGPYIFRSDYLVIRCYSEFVVVDYIEKNSSKSIKKKIPNLLYQLQLN